MALGCQRETGPGLWEQDVKDKNQWPDTVPGLRAGSSGGQGSLEWGAAQWRGEAREEAGQGRVPGGQQRLPCRSSARQDRVGPHLLPFSLGRSTTPQPAS